MIRLIVTDIDGTLVPEGGSYVNPEYMSVIRGLLDLGVQFAAASGRQASSIDAVFHELKDRIYYLGQANANTHLFPSHGESCLKETPVLPTDSFSGAQYSS